jgi:hypothetical protein
VIQLTVPFLREQARQTAAEEPVKLISLSRGDTE